VPSENRPNLVWEMNDNDRKITIATEDNGTQKLVIELDHNREKITIKTDSKTEQVFDNRSSEITIHADSMVRVGDRNAKKEVGIKGTLDSHGDKLIADFASKIRVE